MPDNSLQWIKDCSGESFPWKVTSWDHLDDSGNPRAFALKYFRRGEEHPRLVEYVCASLAADLGIGAPSVELLTVTPDFLESLAKLRRQPTGLAAAQPGTQIGIAWVNAADLARSPKALAGLANRRQPAEIIASDCYFQNDDRHDSNVLVTPASIFGRPNHKLIPIDWGSSFRQRPPLPLLLEPLIGHVSLRESTRTGTLREAVSGAEDFRDIIPRLQQLTHSSSRLRRLINWPPADWGVPEDAKAALLDYFLRRVEVVAERLRQADDHEQVFPNWQEPLAV
jgi:hypothetical protein